MAHDANSRAGVFLAQFEQAKRLQTGFADQWRKYDKVYHGTKDWPKNTADLLRSRLRIPWAWQQIETIIPRIMDPDPKFDFEPVEPGDLDYGRSLNTLSRFDLNKDRFISKQRSFIEDGTVRGLGVAKIIWLRRKQKMKTRRNLSPEETIMVAELEAIGEPVPDELIFEEKEEIVENRPTIIYVDPFDFFWDPKASTDAEWDYVFHRSWLSTATLKEREKKGIYSNVSKIEHGETDSEPRSAYESLEETKARRTELNPVLERFSRDGTKMVMCGETVLYDGPNPYWHGDIPFAVFRSQPTPRSLVGVSEVDKIDHIQEAVWTRDNQRIDAVSLALNQVLILDPTIQGVRNITFRPGAKIYANRSQRVDQLVLDPLQIPAFAETEAYLGAMQQMTGANSILYGANAAQSGIDNTTATGVQAMQEEGGMRMSMKKLEFQLFEARIAKLMTQLNHQYRSAAEIKRILGEAASGYKSVSAAEIPMFLDVIPQGMSESMSRSADMNRANEVLAVAKDLHLAPMGNGRSFTVMPYIEEIIRLQGFDPARSFIPTPPPPPEVPPSG